MDQSRSVKAALPIENAQRYEEKHVHAVYEEIAPHFSSTRYKPWPIIANFLAGIPAGWIGLDSGTGNGKYLTLNRGGDICTIGLDRSQNLLLFARHAGNALHEVIRGDVLDCCLRQGVFDYAISIATIHHLATAERRQLAIERLLEATSTTHGRILIYVWALEQDEKSKRVVPITGTEGKGEDTFVPWTSSSSLKEEDPRIFNRYYHFFAKGELRALIIDSAERLGLHVGPSSEKSDAEVGVEIVQDGWERSNYYAELKRWSR